MSYGQFMIERLALANWSKGQGVKILSAPHLPGSEVDDYARHIGARVVDHPLKTGFVAVVRPFVPEQCNFQDNSEAFAYLCRKMLKVRAWISSNGSSEIAPMPTLLDDDPLQANATGSGWSTIKIAKGSSETVEMAAALAGVRLYPSSTDNMMFINVEMHQRELGQLKPKTRKPKP